MSVGSSMWGVVVPSAGRNLLTNPSGELGTTGWEAVNAPSIGSFSDQQAFGAYSIRVGPTGAGTQGVRMGTYTAVAGGTYTLSVYLLGRVGSAYVLGPQNIATGGFAGGSVIATGIGSWQRLSVMYGESSSINRGLLVAARDASNVGAWWADGAQVEAGTYVTTYIDGDQDGCQWEGGAHASPSLRMSDQRAGGTMMPLSAIGLRPETTPGAGMAPTVNMLQAYAIADGGAYQRTRTESRPLTITATMTGTTYGDLATTRRRVLDVLKASRAPTPAPARLYYWGAGGTTTLDVLYADGLDGAFDNAVSEVVAARFIAPDPAWSDLLDQGTALAPYAVLGSTNYIAYRDPVGRWGTMGAANGTSVTQAVHDIAIEASGTLYAAGAFVQAGGTAAPAVAFWNGAAWGTLGPGTLIWTGAGAIAAYQVRERTGTVFVGGKITTAAGTRAPAIAAWTSAGWGTLGAGSIGPGANIVYAVGFDREGRVYVGGDFVTAGGTVAAGIARWNGAGWGTLPGGTLSGGGTDVYSIAAFAGGGLAVGGNFTGANGSTTGGAGVYTPEQWGQIGGGAVGTAYNLAVTPAQQLYATNSGGTLLRVQAGGIAVAGTATYATPAGAETTDLLALSDGRLLVTGNISNINGGLPLGVGYAIWNGYSYTPPDLIVNGVSKDGVYCAAVAPSGTRYIGGVFNGIGTAASVAIVVNRGMDNSYPVLQMRHGGAGTARVYQLLNTSTGDEIYFNLILIPGEVATLDLRPESLGFTSSVKGTIINTILGGSNLSTWRLAPGTNTISFFADHASLITALYWRPRHLSADGGAPATL